MAVIQFSGNTDDPESFSQRDMDHLIKTHNDTIDAILFVVNYTERTTKAAFEKSLEVRGIEHFEYFTDFPQNKLISGLGFANYAHKENGGGSYEAFSPFLSTKIRNEISDYEETYSELSRRLGKLHWAFQTDMIFAYDKLCAQVKKFKSKYKHVVGLHKMMADLEKNMQTTAQVIGSPEIDWFNGSLTIQQAIAVREKLNATDTPIYPLHIYRDIMRFETIQDQVKTKQHDRSRASHYQNAQQDSAEMADKNIELSQLNIELEKRIHQLEQENAQLRNEKAQLIATKEKMARQMAAAHSGLFGKLAFIGAQRKK